MTEGSSTGLPPRVAAALAYGGWWVTGALFWWLERRDRFVRFHAAQSVVAFGTAAAVIAGFALLAMASLQALPAAFVMFAWAAGVAWGGAVLLWVVAVCQALRGVRWRMPVVGVLAERMVQRDAGPASRGPAWENPEP
jgi:uncharacterized membrane protein